MRDLALKVIQPAIDAGIDVVDSLSSNVCVPYACELVGVALAVNNTTTDIHTFDVMINDVETTIDLVVPDTFDKGIVYTDAKCILQQAERIGLKSNGETATASTDATIAFIFKPLSSRPVGEVWLHGQVMSDIASATSSQTKCVPFSCKLVGYAGSFEAATDALVHIDIMVDNANSGVDVNVPLGSTGGLFTPEASVEVKAGGSLYSTSNGEGTSGGANSVTWVLQPDGPTHPAGWDYLPFSGGIDIGGANNFVDVVSPSSGRVRNLMVHATSPVTVATNFALRVNGVAPAGAPNYVLAVDALDEGGQSMPIGNMHYTYVVEGDLIDVLSGGETDPASNSVGGIWIEPMGGG